MLRPSQARRNPGTGLAKRHNGLCDAVPDPSDARVHIEGREAGAVGRAAPAGARRGTKADDAGRAAADVDGGSGNGYAADAAAGVRTPARLRTAGLRPRHALPGLRDVDAAVAAQTHNLM